MSIESSPDLFNPEEMEQFGLDPNKKADRQEWLNTTPAKGTPVVTDYSQDPFEFGGTTESENPQESTE
jgi:hypothetical protein